jgi:hypothetical protein
MIVQNGSSHQVTLNVCILCKIKIIGISFHYDGKLDYLINI